MHKFMSSSAKAGVLLAIIGVPYAPLGMHERARAILETCGEFQYLPPLGLACNYQAYANRIAASLNLPAERTIVPKGEATPAALRGFESSNLTNF